MLSQQVLKNFRQDRGDGNRAIVTRTRIGTARLKTGVILPTLQHKLNSPVLTNLHKTIEIFGAK